MGKEEIIEQIENHVKEFKKWLTENYSEDSLRKELYDDTGYPNWSAIETTFETAFKELPFEDLNEEELENISFLLARQWNVGIIFPYFKEEISQIGMTENQLLILAEYGLKSKEWSFKQQCAASIYKVQENKKKAIEIALKYNQDTDVHIRRYSLLSLHKLGYKHLIRLLKRSWEFGDELERNLCLEICKEVDNSNFKLD